MDDGQNLIVKIPYPNVGGPPVLTTASEVATMDFVRTVLELPVPKVLAWESSENNPVDAQYIMMEYPKGYPEGYHQFADLLALNQNLMFYRSFKGVHMRLLLDLQDDIAELEWELDDMDIADSVNEPERLRSRRNDDNRKRPKLEPDEVPVRERSKVLGDLRLNVLQYVSLRTKVQQRRYNAKAKGTA
ncbi:hypothetical protein K402DRAFT_461099 [Aulographum hederae CBS 113979]|uniref:Altered inheritance of mitochondria protein 9, mitochondrial n=1 Tax=Aulographum hederae CBS 113979 TaxID=1176131 RepID=A0A6G1H964_9PEZI|nr:hypothetical protein K402DRAFT_461099 [Aulographum hederae CBS 113979]